METQIGMLQILADQALIFFRMSTLFHIGNKIWVMMFHYVKPVFFEISLQLKLIPFKQIPSY